MTNHEYYQSLKDKGLCVNCRKAKSEPNKIYCAECSAKKSKDRHDLRVWYQQHHICWYCGKEKIYGNETVCPECAAKKYTSTRKTLEKKYGGASAYQKSRNDKLKQQGICQDCGKEKAVKGKTFCQGCLDKRKYRSRKYYLKKTEGTIKRSERTSYGLCYICGNPIDTNKKLCSNCCNKYTGDKIKRGVNIYWVMDNKIAFGGMAHG